MDDQLKTNDQIKFPYSVLLIEDDVITSLLWKNTIEKNFPNAKIHWVTNANAAKKEWELQKNINKNFDLIVTDIFLSGDDTGLDLLAQLNMNEKTKVIISSQVSESDFYKMRDESNPYLTYYMQKPFDLKLCEVYLKKLMFSKDQ